MSNWKRIPAVLVLIALVVGFLLPARAVASNDLTAPSVVINEVMWSGSAAASTDEWIELRNTTNSPIDISGWKLTGAASAGGALTVPAGKVIAAGGFFVIAHYGSSDAHTVLNIEPDWVTTSLVAKNSDAQYVLSDTTGTVIDQADDGHGAPLAGDNTTKASMERNATSGDGTLPTSWHTAFTSINFDLGAIGQGTPGTPNSNHAPVAAAGDDQTVGVGHEATFDASDSEDGDGSIVSYAWNFGDGQVSAQLSATHSFAKLGNYIVTLTVTDDAGETNTDQATVTVVDYSASRVRINELLPNPTGADETGEWIELYNDGAGAVDLSGWQLDDGPDGSTLFTFPAGTTLANHAYLIVYRTDARNSALSSGVALNNDTDSVRLFDPLGDLRDNVTYAGNAVEGQAYALTSTGWHWVSVTPGALNAEFHESSGGGTSDDQNTDNQNSTEEPQTLDPQETADTSVTVLSIAKAKAQSDGSAVVVDGVVTALPNVLGDKVLYVQDASAGVQVYVSNASLPNIVLGDVVRINGTVSQLKTGARVTLASGGIAVVLRHDNPFPPTRVVFTKFNDALLGTLVSVDGTVVKNAGDSFYVNDGTGEVRVFIKASTGIKKPAIAKGDHYIVVGILDKTSSGYRVLPRTLSDMKDPKANPAEGSAASTLVSAGASVLAPVLITLVIVSGFVAVWFVKKRLHIKNDLVV